MGSSSSVSQDVPVSDIAHIAAPTPHVPRLGNRRSSRTNCQDSRKVWYIKSNIKEFLNRLREGDLIEFKGEFTEHWAVCVEVEEEFAMLIHMTEGAGVVKAELKSILKDEQCRINNENDENLEVNSPGKTVNRADIYLKHPEHFGLYNAITNSSQHFANFCRYNVRN